jgi:hypothetical protein
MGRVDAGSTGLPKVSFLGGLDAGADFRRDAAARCHGREPDRDVDGDDSKPTVARGRLVDFGNRRCEAAPLVVGEPDPTLLAGVHAQRVPPTHVLSCVKIAGVSCVIRNLSCVSAIDPFCRSSVSAICCSALN